MWLSRRLVVLAAACGALAACTVAPPQPVYPDLRFSGEPPIRLDVARIVIVDAYQPPYSAPNVEHLFPVPPAKAAENWAQDRLRAVGQSGEARFTVRNASVVETDLSQTQGIKGAFTTEPSQRYDMALQVTLDIIDASGRAVRTANVISTRSQSVLNTVTPNERTKTWYDMTSALMVDFDRQMSHEISSSFGLYFVP